MEKQRLVKQLAVSRAKARAVRAEEVAKNPRWAMMCATARRMAPEKKASHLEAANSFLAQL